MYRFPLLRNFAMLFCLFFSLVGSALAQTMGSLRGQVLDPAGAAVPGAAVTLTQGSMVRNTESGADGAYSIKQLAAGTYSLDIQAPGFAAVTKTVVIAAGQARLENVTLTIAVQQQ